MKIQVILDESSDEVVAVIVSFLHAESGRVIPVCTGFPEQFEVQFSL